MNNFYNVSHFRCKRNLTRQELSNMCGFPSQNKIWRIENGKLPLKYSDCELIAKQLNISSRWLVDSPYTFTRQSIIDLLNSVSKFCGTKLLPDGFVSFPSRYSIFLIALNKKKSELSEEDFFNYYVNLSKNNVTEKTFDDNSLLAENIFKYAEARSISEYDLGIILGFESAFALDWVLQVKYGERELASDNVNMFLSHFKLSKMSLLDGFVVNSIDSFEHSLLAMYESPVGRFSVSDDGSIKFCDNSLSKFLSEKAQNGKTFPLIFE